MKKGKRILAAFLAVLMVVAIMPFTSFSGIFTSKAKAAESGTVSYKLADAGLAAKITSTVQAGTDNYFTINATESKAVETADKAKTFEDGTKITQTLKMGSGNQGNITSRSISFTVKTGTTATVSVYGIASGGKNADGNYTVIGLYDSEGKLVKASDNVMAETTPVTTFDITEAGTYYIADYKAADAASTYKGLNIYGVTVDQKSAVVEPVEKEYSVADAGLAAKITSAVQAGTDNYFTINATESKAVETADKAKTFEDGTKITQTLKMGSGNQGNITSRSISFTVKTGATATVSVYGIASGGKNADGNYTVIGLYDSEGKLVKASDNVMAETTPVTTFDITEAGTYYIADYKAADAASTYKGLNIYGVTVKEKTSGSSEVTRKEWSLVKAPEITNVKQEDNKVVVDFAAVVGDDGADKVSVTMTDPEGKQTVNNSTKKGENASVEFTPSYTGKYVFSIVATRADENDKEGNTVEFMYALPLSAPSISSATSMGNGTVSLVWQSVKEATSYNVYVDGTKVGSTTETTYDVTGLTVDTKYEFAVEAVRETPAAVSDKSTVSATATAEAKQVWGYIVYGNGASESNAAYEGSINETGSVTLRSGKLTDGKFTGSSNNGKLVPASFDGLNFYYTAVPTSLNFTLRAKVTVDQWWLSNGQEGFGLMAADQLGGSGWNNSYMAVASKTEYYWNEEEGKVTNDTTALKVTQKIGLASQEKKGVTKDNIGAIEANDTQTIVDNFSSAMYPLEQRYPEGGNIIGNATKAVDGTIENPITEMYLTIQKNNTGYFVSYESVDGTYSTTKKYYDTETLSQIDTDNVYVGFFTSRYAQATFSDVTFTTIDPADDAPAEEKPIEELVTNASFNSKSSTGTSDYEFRFTANCDGTLSIWDSEGNEIATDVAVAANTVVKPATTTLNVGKNKFTYVFTPDADYIPEKDMVMSSYEPIEGTFTVTYRTYGVEGQSIYVAPGKYGVGTKEDPMSIYDAVKYVQPGQTIVVMEGTYYLEKTIKVERGVDGTADKPIQMVADPEASSRPVFDFQGLCSGMVLAGNYWYFQGFDVTNSANAQKGIQLSGKYNTMDNIMTYHNGNTGLQISRYLTTDEFDMWPAYNLILNCTSYGNADAGYEDADGFAAKLTVGDGNVFDGCISYNNADDGWDLFAKVQTGSIGVVTIKNSVAYGNGYLEDGTDAGNGNGFKLGGDSMSGKHVLENCVAFDNKAKGIDSNSCPDINVINCTTFNNESYNIALYTNSAKNTDFSATGVLSYRTYMKDNVEQFKLLGTQDKTKVDNDTNYFWNYEGTAKNSAKTVTDDWFESVDTTMDYSTHVYASHKVTRNADNTINMNGLLVLTDKAAANAGARMTGTPSAEIVVPEGIKGHKTISITGNDVVKGNTTDVAVVQGTSTDIVWTIDADASTFDYIMVDDVVLDASKYTVVANGNTTVVTFKASYIKSLKAAEHTFRACFTDGYIAETKLEVLPKTGDFSRNMIAVYAGIMLMALLAAGVVLFEKKRKRA